MKTMPAFPRVRLGRPAWALWLAISVASAFSATASVWTNDISGNASGQWSDSFDWSAGVPDRAAAIADFSQLSLSGNSAISLASPETVGSLLFANTAETNGSTLAVDGPNGNQLTLNNGRVAPTIVVSNVQAFLGGIAGFDGFVLNGNGALAIYGSTYGNSMSGPIFVNGGLLGMVTGQSFAGITGNITVAAGATFQANDDFDSTILANNFFLSGSGGTPSGYASNPTVPDGTTYWSEPLPMGALDVGYNVTMSGNITLSGDTTISHGYNGATINGPIGVTNAGQNLVLATTIANQSPLAVNGPINLGQGSLTVSGVADAAPVTLGGSNTFAGGTFITGGGTLQVGYPYALDPSSGLTITGGGTLDLFDNNMTFSFLSGGSGIITDSSIIGSGTNTLLTITQTNSTFFGGSINDGPANPLALTLDGNGSLTLGGTNDYSGPTMVLSGELLGGSGGNCTNSGVTVANGATNGFQALIAAGQWSCLSLLYEPGTNYLLFNFGDLPVSPNNPAPIVVADALTISGVLNVLVTNGLWLATGEYPLLNYQGALSGALPTNLLALPAGVTATLTNDAAHNLLALNVTQIPVVVLSTQTNGVWTNNVGGNISGFWGVAGNWSNSVVAGGPGGIADFSRLDITVNSVISNDAPRTIGTLLLADPVTSGVTVTIDGGLSNHLTLATSSGPPVISVSNLQALIGGLSGTQGFVMQGNGALAIYGNKDANSLKGPISVNSGLLATVDGAGFLGVTGAITVASGASFSANGGMDNSTLLNNFNLSGAGDTPMGLVTNASTPDGVYMTQPSFGALDLLGNIFLGGAIALNSNAVITHGSANAVINGPITAAGRGQNLQLVTTASGQPDLTINGNMSLGSGVLTVNGSGSQGVTLGGANAFAGTVLNSGMLHLDNINALGNTNVTVNGGVLDLNTQNITVSSLSGAGAAVITDNGSSSAPTVLTVTYSPTPCTPIQPGDDPAGFVQPTSTTFPGAIEDGPADAVSLTLQGCGALILGGTNTYSGPTTVSSGELVGLTTGSCSSSVVTVSSGAANGVQIAAPGGQWACARLSYAPGSENLDFNFGATAPSTTIAPLLVNGDLTFNGTVAVTITVASFNSWTTGSYPLMAYTGALSNMPASATFHEAVPQAGTLLATLTNNLAQGIIYLDVVNTNTITPPNTNAPAIVAVYAGSTTNLSLRFPSSASASYVLETAPSLGQTIIWTPVSTNVGTGGSITNNLPVNRSLQQQYFRLVLLGSSSSSPTNLLSSIVPVYQSGTGSLGLQTSTLANHNYILESTLGLGGTNVWTPMSTNAGTGGTITATVTVNRTGHDQFFRFLVQ
ncbi:MAG: beta strand repeat-containing protein [Limisphaerales bacterium]